MRQLAVATHVSSSSHVHVCAFSQHSSFHVCFTSHPLSDCMRAAFLTTTASAGLHCSACIPLCQSQPLHSHDCTHRLQCLQAFLSGSVWSAYHQLWQPLVACKDPLVPNTTALPPQLGLLHQTMAGQCMSSGLSLVGICPLGNDGNDHDHCPAGVISTGQLGSDGTPQSQVY